jgi:hypothetical protein
VIGFHEQLHRLLPAAVLERLPPGGERTIDDGRRPIRGRPRGRLHQPEPDRFAREGHASPLAALGDPELGIQVEQVLLDRGLGDD